MSGEDVRPPRRPWHNPALTGGDHEHKFYLFKTQNSFEPVLDDDMPAYDLGPLYRMVEYAIMFCNCGEVIKNRVKSRGKD